jgi:hypothetical protein
MFRGTMGVGGYLLDAVRGAAANIVLTAAAEKAAEKFGPAAGAVVPYVPILVAILGRRGIGGAAFRRFTRRLRTPVARPGSAELQAVRQRLGASAEAHTVAVGRTNVRGLEAQTFEGASTTIRKQAGNAGLPANHPIQSPNANPLFSGHAEEVLANDFVAAVDRAKIPAVKVQGELFVHISNPSGVCNICAQGLKPGSTVPAGVIRQLSEKYPNLTIRFTAAGGMARPNLAELAVRNGRIVE